jgi:tripartite-type tricarboxylate transporter receptor subunit TctC
MKTRVSFLRASSLFACAVSLIASVALDIPAAKAQDAVAAFYKGRTIDIVIGFPPGGSYDTFARLAADYMGKYIPGNPNLVVENKPTSGAAMIATFFETVPKDGSTISILPQTIASDQLMQPDLSKWDVRRLNYIGSFRSVNNAFMLRKGAAAQTVDELKSTSVNVGCNNHFGVTYIDPVILKNLGGLKFNIICGYPGTSNFPPALARGEIDLVSGDWATWKALSKTMPGELTAVIQDGLKRHKDLPDVPLMQELVSDPTSKEVIEFISAGSAIGRALVAPPGIPADRLAALRAAFDKMVKDPEFLATANKRGEEIDPTSGEDVQRVSNDILATPPAVVKIAIEATK